MIDGGSQGKNSEPDDFEFDCPECGTHINGECTECPTCGVEFIIELVEDFVCPECGEGLDVDATVCPKCGTEFEIIIPTEPSTSTGEGEVEMEAEPEIHPEAEEEIGEEEPTEEVSEEELLKEEFPRLVAEVKPILALAREFDVDTPRAKILIDKAVAAGKQGDLKQAVENVRECRESIESSIESRVTSDIEDLDKLSDIAVKMGADPSPIRESQELARRELETRDFKAALTHAKEGMRRAESSTGKYLEAQTLVRELERIIENAGSFDIDTSEARKILEESRNAERNDDYTLMGIMARKGTEQIMGLLPDEIKEEMKRAKGDLLEAKAEGKDVSVVVKLLKEAASCLNSGRYGEALEKLIEVRLELQRI